MVVIPPARLGLGLCLCLGQDDPVLSVLGPVGVGGLDQEIVPDVELLIDAVEKGLAERPALQVQDGLPQQVHAGADVRVLGDVAAVVAAARQDAQPALEGVDAVDVQHRQPFLAEEDLVLQDRLLHQVLVGCALVLAAGQGVRPALAEGELADGLLDDAVEGPPRLRVERRDGDDDQVGALGPLARGERLAAAGRQGNVHHPLLELGRDVLEGRED